MVSFLFSAFYHPRKKPSASSSTRSNQLTGRFLGCFDPPVVLDAVLLEAAFQTPYTLFILPPEVSLAPNEYPDIALFGKRSSPIRVTPLANKILRVHPVVTTVSHPVLVSGGGIG